MDINHTSEINNNPFPQNQSPVTIIASNHANSLRTQKSLDTVFWLTLILSFYYLISAYKVAIIIYIFNMGNSILGTLPYQQLKAMPIYSIIPVVDIITSGSLFLIAQKIISSPKKGMKLALIVSIVAFFMAFINDRVLEFQTNQVTNKVNSTVSN